MEGPPEGAATPTTTEQLGHGGEGCRDVQSRRKRYWQAYEESEREDPAEIFPEGVDGYGESAQSTQSLTLMCEVV